MTSKERREARYQRRKAQREAKCKNLTDALGTFDDIFSYKNLYDAFALCKDGVRWKASIQSYEANLSINTYEIYEKLKLGKWKSRGFTKFMLSERGKMRQIQSVHISERCIQRTLCDKYLIPILQRSLIYDNGASMKGKGTKFAMDRLHLHLEQYQKEYGDEGYILLWDFSNYFGSIQHDILYRMIDEKLPDRKIRKLYHQLIDAFDEGLGLGSQASQISAVFFANLIDHTIKDKLGIKKSARYMDDGYIISNSLEELHMLKKVLFDLCNELGLIINDRKVRICKLSHGFTYLKKRYRLRNGKITVKLSRASFKACKRRLKRMKEKNLPPKHVWQAYNSWRGTCVFYDNWYKVKQIDAYYNKLFVDDFREEKENERRTDLTDVRGGD